ncbi:SLC39A13 [Lepeophtheirus salmonis]|uniref:SLC39A13 n=2 Tax=Lepeophtheirus salmonis TaxID=72036 RepID=A0A7R8CMA2_LEPSM|nr:SLC39A13 [Lepeophtheirus salmonis]CAF2864987.1 SLC39A13 [Lepeophtheirus salmonis]
MTNNISYEVIDTPSQLPGWLGAAFGSSLVGLAGMLPCLFLSDVKTRPLMYRFLLSFAVGGLLGDTFLQILPESYSRCGNNQSQVGLGILLGLFVCLFIETFSHSPQGSGYSNLLANSVDNLNHGLSIGSAFSVSTKVGILTTVCILLHEIPHEIGDFALLLESGFTSTQAAKAQFGTAAVGVCGAILALGADSIESLSLWILPFTAGGFLNIALVSSLPGILASSKSKEDSVITAFGILSETSKWVRN